MESNGERMRIHMSDTTAELLEPYFSQIEARGQVPIKGKGLMNTFWLDVPMEVESDDVADNRI